MTKLKLRTKFVLSMLFVTTGLTTFTLMLVQRTLESRVRSQIAADLTNSVKTFLNVQRQREITRVSSAQLMADLPIVRALMTSNDRRTIQDASTRLWNKTSTDLLILADAGGNISAAHCTCGALQSQPLRAQLAASLREPRTTYWWNIGEGLYEVSLHPVYFGFESDNRIFGYVAIGAAVDDNLIRSLRDVAGSEVTFLYDGNRVRSTLPAAHVGEWRQMAASAVPAEVALGGEHFLVSSVDLQDGPLPPVRLVILKSLDAASDFLRRLNRLLLTMGLLAIASGTLLVFVISHQITRPLQRLVGGVRALSRGDYDFPLDVSGNDEVGEVSAAFDHMRSDLRGAQHKLIEAERLATIGQMASSISHDMRHHLVAVMANSEFLADGRSSSSERSQLHQEILASVNDMNELIESLLEFSRTRESLRPVFASVADCATRAIQTVRAHPEFQGVAIEVRSEGDCHGWFDAKKIERVFLNLLFNACAVVCPRAGRIEISLCGRDGVLQAIVADNGPGLDADVRDRIFEPFFSHGKENGTGLGLTIAAKILHDHGGDIRLTKSSAKGAVFAFTLPLIAKPTGAAAAAAPEGVTARNRTAE